MHYIPAVQVTPPEKPKTLINTPFLGVFFCFIATAKATSSGAENSPKRYPAASTLKKPLLGVGVTVGVTFSPFFGSIKVGV